MQVFDFVTPGAAGFLNFSQPYSGRIDRDARGAWTRRPRTELAGMRKDGRAVTLKMLVVLDPNRGLPSMLENIIY
jgi:hypothetical protein